MSISPLNDSKLNKFLCLIRKNVIKRENGSDNNQLLTKIRGFSHHNHRYL